MRLGASSLAAGAVPAEGAGALLGSGGAAAYIDCGRSVIAVTAAGVARMPNGVAVHAPALPRARAGAPVGFSRDEISYGGVVIDLRGAALWDPAVPVNDGFEPDAVAARGRDILHGVGVDSHGWAAGGLAAGLDALGRALAERDADGAERARGLLLGRGGGLTPEGDDLLAGAAAGLAAFAGAAGIGDDDGARLRRALCSENARDRTSSLSATLLELAAAGRAAEPLGAVLDLGRGPARWRPALRALVGVGHSTGRAWAVGSGLAATMLVAHAPAREEIVT